MIDVILAVQKSSIYPNEHVLRNEEAYLIKKATCEILDDAKLPPTRKELKMVKKVLSISDEMRALMKRKQDELVKKFCTKCGSKRKAVPYGKDRVKFICSKRCKRKSFQNILHIEIDSNLHTLNLYSGNEEKSERRFCAKSGIERPLEGLCRCTICVQKNESKWKENVDKWRVGDDKTKKKKKEKKKKKKTTTTTTTKQKTKPTKPIKRKMPKTFKTISTKRFKKKEPSSMDDVVDDSPEGLPDGWKVIIRFRGKRDGKAKGKYKLYVSPCGQVCRSLVEVQNFLDSTISNNTTTVKKKTKTISTKKIRKRKQREVTSTNSSGSASSSPSSQQYQEEDDDEEMMSKPPESSVAWFRVAIPKRAGGPGDKFRIRIPGKESILTSIIPAGKTAGDLVYIDTSSVEQDADSGAMMVMSYSEIPNGY